MSEMIQQTEYRVIPIDLPPVEVTICADRQLAFSVLTAFDSVRPSERGSLSVLEREGDRWLIEFRTPYTFWFGRRSTFVTTESVTTQAPELIEFRLARPSGYLAHLYDRFILDSIDGVTRFRYESSFGMRGSILGWVFGKVVVAPLIRRHMRHHAGEVKQMVESRARRGCNGHRQGPAPPSASI